MLIAPLGIALYHFKAAFIGKQLTHGIHFFKQAADIGGCIMLLPVAMGYKIFYQLCFSGITALAVKAAMGQVVHKIGKQGFGCYLH